MRRILNIVILLAPIFVSAQIITDRPDFTESAMVVPRGSYQLESGIARISQNKSLSPLDWSMPNVLLRSGINDKLELRMFMNNSVLRSNTTPNVQSSGLNNFEIGFKYAFKEKEDVTQLGLMGHWVLPTDDFSRSYDYNNYLIGLLGSSVLGKHWSVGYNLVYQARNSIEDIAFATISFVDAINDKWSFFIEFKGEMDFNQYQRGFLHSGFTYLVNENMQLDFSYANSADVDGDRSNLLSSGLSFLILPKR